MLVLYVVIRFLKFPKKKIAADAAKRSFSMVEVRHTAWRELLLKHGLLQVADILEKYGIASAIDVSELKQDDFDALQAQQDLSV